MPGPQERMGVFGDPPLGGGHPEPTPQEGVAGDVDSAALFAGAIVIGQIAATLLEELQHILGLNEQWNVAVVGVGRLGKAILSYPGFTPDGFHIVAALDNNQELIGQEVEGVAVRPIEDLPRVVQQHNIQIAVVAVPSRFTQQVIDNLVECGVRAILNYAPISPQVPTGVNIRNIDPVLSLQSMTYFLANGSGEG